jgi:hypothetical protein
MSVVEPRCAYRPPVIDGATATRERGTGAQSNYSPREHVKSWIEPACPYWFHAVFPLRLAESFKRTGFYLAANAILGERFSSGSLGLLPSYTNATAWWKRGRLIFYADGGDHEQQNEMAGPSQMSSRTFLRMETICRLEDRPSYDHGLTGEGFRRTIQTPRGVAELDAKMLQSPPGISRDGVDTFFFPRFLFEKIKHAWYTEVI